MRSAMMAIILALTSAMASVQADGIKAPAGRVVLAISVDQEARSDAEAARFDMDMLDAMPQQEIVAVTPWTEGETVFTGVSLRHLLETVGVRDGNATISAVALNDYKVEIPASDAFEHGVIIASRMNGETMSVREKGPLWVIYPISDKPEIDTQKTYSKMIWQLKRLDVR